MLPARYDYDEFTFIDIYLSIYVGRIMAKRLDYDHGMNLNSSRAITYTFGQIPSGKR